MTTNKRPPIIALCGTSTSNETEDAIARETCRLLAEKGALVLCGGLAGVMSSGRPQGVTEAGGTCIGFLPGTDADEGNEYLSFAIPTGMGEMRNGLLARASAGMIAIGGGYGTLSEIGFGARLRQAGGLRGHLRNLSTRHFRARPRHALVRGRSRGNRLALGPNKFPALNYELPPGVY